jgi:hypothetical protein
MQLEDLETHLASVGLDHENTQGGSDTFLVIQKIMASDGVTYDVGVKRTAGTPWVPESALHVRPHRVPMGQNSSQGSPLGGEWQYLSRQFNRPPTPKSFLAHVLTVLDSP